MGVGTFIAAGRSLDTAMQRAERAEQLGYESVFVTHIAGRDALSVLAAYATRTSRVRLGTGVVPIYSRTPAAMAQIAATVDELAGGRLVLGIGVSHRVTVEGWYGQRIERPVAEMRAYVAALRAIFAGEQPPAEGRFATHFRFAGFEPRAELPIYVAALSPAMLRLAGEVADGLVLWLCTPEYVRDVVVPEVARGRERAGKPLEGFDVVAAVPAAVTSQPAEARDRLRGDLIPYFSLPFYRAMIERSGYAEDVAAYDAEMASGGPRAAAAAISDRYLESLAAIGSPEQAAAQLARYREAGAVSPCVGPVPRTDFDATLEGLASVAG